MEAKNPNIKQINAKMGELQREFPQSLNVKVVFLDVLIHQNRHAEADNVIKELAKSNIVTDPPLVLKFTKLLQELGKTDALVELYQKGWEANKATSDGHRIARDLFGAYVQKRDFNLQKQFAMEMYRAFKDEKYTAWNLVATAVGASSEEEKKKTMLLNLAATMFEKQVIGTKQEITEQQALFFLGTLKSNGNFDKALEFLNSPVCKASMKIEFQLLERIAEVYFLKGKYEEAMTTYANLLLNEKEDWQYYASYADCFFRLFNQADSALPLVKTLDSFVESITKKYQSRDAHLFLVLIEKNRLIKDLTRPLSTYLSLLKTYFEKFGSKPCAFLDLRHALTEFTASVSFEKRILDETNVTESPQAFYSHLIHAIEPLIPSISETSTDAEKIRSLEFGLSLAQLQYCLGSLPSSDRFELSRKYYQLYLTCEAIPSESSRIRKTELGLGDKYLLLSVIYLLDQWQADSTSVSLFEVVYLLEIFYKNSPANYYPKLLLMRLYSYLGAIHRSFEIWEAMELRHIQIDTLSHYIVCDLYRNLAANEAHKAHKQSKKFYSDVETTNVRNILECYENGTYTMISEFTTFADRLKYSANHVLVDTEQTLLGLFQKGANVENVTKFFVDSVPVIKIQENSSIAAVERISNNGDWKILDFFALKPLNEIKGWAWPALFTGEAANSFFFQQSSRGTDNGFRYQFLQRNLHLLLLNDLLRKKTPSPEYLALYRETQQKLGFDESASSFDALSSFVISRIYSVHSILLQICDVFNGKLSNDDAAKIESESLPALLDHLTNVTALLERLFASLTQSLSKPTTTEAESTSSSASTTTNTTTATASSAIRTSLEELSLGAECRLPFVSALLLTCQTLTCALKIFAGFVPPKTSKKNGGRADMHQQVNKSLAQVHDGLKKLIATLQTELEAAGATKPTDSKAFVKNMTVASISTIDTKLVDQIIANVYSSRKILLQERLLGFTREMNKELATVKF